MILITYSAQWVVICLITGGNGGERRTVVIILESERVPRPYGDETLTIVSKRMQHHILDAVRLCGAPDHDVEPCASLRREEIRAKSSKVRSAHDAARGRVRQVLAAEGLGGTRGAEEERAVEVQHEELARRVREGFGGC